MITIQARCNESRLIKIIKDPICVVLKSCCEHYDFIVLVHFTQKFDCTWSWLVCSEFLNHIKNQKVILQDQNGQVFRQDLKLEYTQDFLEFQKEEMALSKVNYSIFQENRSLQPIFWHFKLSEYYSAFLLI